ncbi:MAG: DsbA family protein [Solirubrobacteraceae bacterium]|nr:DsbA family protein [Solirubrobacteraceae bacterium]
MSDSALSGRPRFLVDLGSPYAYLAAERIDTLLPDAEWQVVLLGGIFRATGRDSWANGASRADGQAEIERRALQRGLPPMRWPEPWPSDGLLAARVATWADLQGAGRAFIVDALRTHFALGRTLSDPAVVAEVAARAGIDPAAALDAATTADVKHELRVRTERALTAGVFGVPSVLVGQFVCWGDDQLEQAATLASSTTRARLTT